MIQLVGDEGDKLNHVRGRLKEQRLPYTFNQGTVTNCRETCPNDETGEVTLDVEVDTCEITGEDVDFTQVLKMFQKVLHLKDPQEQDVASSSTASPARSDVPNSQGADVPASSGVAVSTEGNEERGTEDPWAAEHVQIVREELRMVKLWKCSEQHSCTILAAKTSMTCDECGATIRRKDGYLHCFTCEPARTACYRCMRQFHGAGLPPDGQGDPCPELCDFHLTVDHEGKTRVWK